MTQPHLTLPCPKCGRLLPAALDDPARELACECGESVALVGVPAPSGTAPANCRVCGGEFLYWRKDFNQKIGCLIVAIGAALVPWSYGVSMAVAALVDFILYWRLPKISVCYICDARYHRLPPHPDHRPYDLMTAQTYEARSLNWTEGRTRIRGTAETPRPD